MEKATVKKTLPVIPFHIRPLVPRPWLCCLAETAKKGVSTDLSLKQPAGCILSGFHGIECMVGEGRRHFARDIATNGNGADRVCPCQTEC